MSDRPHRARKPNKKYDKRDFVSGDEQSSSSKSESLSESSETIPGCMSSSFLHTQPAADLDKTPNENL
ncbi:hypothetical protein SprV_0702329300 [Sparganum proliferum]